MRLAVLLASTALICACATETAPPPAPIAPPVAEGPPPAPAAKAQIGSFGFDESGMDRTVAPGDNFYQFANGTWAKNTPIPADKSNYGMFTVLDDLSRERTRTIIEEAAKDPANRIGAAYGAFLDQQAIDAKGLEPIRPWLDSIRNLKTKSAYTTLWSAAERRGIPGPFSFFVGVDDKKNSDYALTLFQGGIGMPDRDYYLSGDKNFVDLRARYLDHLTKMLTLAGEPDAAVRAKAIMAFETSVAKVHWTQVDSRDATKTYNKMAVTDLARRAPGIDFRALLTGFGMTGPELIVAQPSAVTGIAGLVARAPLGVLKDQLLVRSLERYSAVLPATIDRQVFAFYGTALSGTPQLEERWKRGVDFTTGALSDDVSQIYVQRYFPPETKAAADELVRNVLGAMGRRIDQLSWMSPETKVRARAKLANFTVKIGYPSQWRDFSQLRISREDAFGNAVRSAEFEHGYAINKLGNPVRKWEWQMTPMEINAYADFGRMEVVFPAAILQPPFFDPHADAAINYGGIGAVIGHEISHHFDDQGSKYDEHGLLDTWWTDADLKAFKAATQALVTQYDAYEPLPGAKLKGAFTLGENIGDLAGLTIAYDAWQASLAGKPPELIDGFTGEQRFYLGWAQIWRRNYREANLRQRLVVDPHSPSEYRVATFRNLDPWYVAYGVQTGQKLYLPPEQRVRIW